MGSLIRSQPLVFKLEEVARVVMIDSFGGGGAKSSPSAVVLPSPWFYSAIHAPKLSAIIASYLSGARPPGTQTWTRAGGGSFFTFLSGRARSQDRETRDSGNTLRGHGCQSFVFRSRSSFGARARNLILSQGSHNNRARVHIVGGNSFERSETFRHVKTLVQF